MPPSGPSICDRISAAESGSKVDTLLGELAGYTRASDQTRAKAAKLARKRRAELSV